VTPDGKYLVGVANYTWTVWDLATGKELHVLPGHRGPVGAAAFAPDGKTLVTSGSDASYLWDVATGKQKHRLAEKVPKAVLPSAAAALRHIGFSGDGKLVATAGVGNVLQLWDAANGNLLRTWEDKWGPVAFMPGSDVLAVWEGNGLRLWHAASGKPAYSWIGRTTRDYHRRTSPWTVAWTISADGHWLAVVVQRQGARDQSAFVLELWHLATGKKRDLLMFDPPAATGWGIVGLDEVYAHKRGFDRLPVGLLFSPDGKHLAIGTLHAVHLFDAATGKELRQLAGPNVFGGAAAFAPDGKVLATGTFDGTVRLWDVATGTVLREVAGHDLLVSSVAFSADGKLLASASFDSTVLLWNVQELLQPVPVKWTDKELEQCWADLGAVDAEQADRAMTKLLASPAQASALFKKRLQPVAPADPKLVADLLESLNSPKFAERDQASKKLEELADLVRPALEKCLASKPSLEMRKRLEALLDKLDAPLTRPEVLRGLRAVEVLERLATPEARALLEILAGGAPAALLTQEARASLGRWTK
jgi:WD40 repeat protein